MGRRECRQCNGRKWVPIFALSRSAWTRVPCPSCCPMEEGSEREQAADDKPACEVRDLPSDACRYKVPGGWIYEIPWQYDLPHQQAPDQPGFVVGVSHVFVPEGGLR